MDLEPIPGPPGLPFIGNLLDMRDDEAPLRAMERMAEIYGPVYRLSGRGPIKQIVVSTADLMKEVMDEKRFFKQGLPGLMTPGQPNGLIIAGTQDPDWEQGHRILRPSFGPIKIEEMFNDMKDIVHQLILKWARFGGEDDIAVTDDFSNLTLDIVALCTMGFRFNSFYRDGMHPYVQAMSHVLAARGNTGASLPLISKALSLMGSGNKTMDSKEIVDDVAFMRNTAQEIIDQRRSNPTKRNDFLGALIFNKDPKTGETMRDELIAAQMQTFLVAGHETTSGLLSFALLFLLQNPETYEKAQSEIDNVVGKSAVTLQHIRDLKYIYAVLQETLRLVPTAPTISKIPNPHLKQDLITLGGKYKLEPTDRLRVLLGKCMQDPTVFGDDAKEFNPERMLESNPDAERIQSYWRPFSEGSRACLGRPMSLQEAMLAMTLILQNFDVRLSDPMYKMRIKQAVTVKPSGFYIKASLRHGMSPLDLERRLHNGDDGVKQTQKVDETGFEANESGAPLKILFGTNTGTCQALAQKLASEAASTYGFNPEVIDMDAAARSLPKDQPVVIITPSYEGEPPDNALQFVQYLEGLNGNALASVKYAVFGCGHKDWHATFHRIPKLVNSIMKDCGAQRIAEIGLSDVSKGNPMQDFENWLDKTLLPELAALAPKSAQANQTNATPNIEAEISTGERAETLRQDLGVGTVIDVKVLTTPGEHPEKMHMEVELPSGSTYDCGDYLAILPQSPEPNVRAVMSHFKLPVDATINLKSRVFAPLPLNSSLSVADLLRNYFELAKPTTRRGLSLAATYAKDESVRNQISSWLDNDEKLQAEITDARVSIFDILKKFPQIDMPFPAFLSLLPPLNIRQYSISSSPLRHPDKCTITYSVITDQKKANTPFYGVATTYLQSLKPGDRLQMAVRRTAKKTFRLPADAAKTPLLMFAAGTGLAPFRGFIQQRSIQLEANPNTKLAPAHLFLGCRSSTGDRLYADEMEKWQKQGAVNIYYSFSREPEKSNGARHVPDRMALESDTISNAWLAGARAYTCGNREFAEGVSNAAKGLVEQRVEARKAEGWSQQNVDERKAAIFGSFSERAADDVFD